MKRCKKRFEGADMSGSGKCVARISDDFAGVVALGRWRYDSVLRVSSMSGFGGSPRATGPFPPTAHVIEDNVDKVNDSFWTEFKEREFGSGSIYYLESFFS
jgi:hypothetical protein